MLKRIYDPIEKRHKTYSFHYEKEEHMIEDFLQLEALLKEPNDAATIETKAMYYLTNFK